MVADRELGPWLVAFVERHGGVAGSVHRLGEHELVLAAAHNIPPVVQDLTRRITRGKGMAGLAWERGVPVQTCNLQTDETGDVRPGARAVDAGAAVAIPVHDPDGSLVAVVGIAFPDERTLSDADLELWTADAAGLPRGSGQ